MAKVTLKIDGKNKIFSKDKLNLGAMKAQAEFEEKLQNGFGYMSEIQELYRKHRGILTKVEKVEKELADAETEEEQEAVYIKLDELEATEEYQAFQDKLDELRSKAEQDTNTDFQVYDEFAELLVKVFDNQFTVDEVFDGLEIENSFEETYAKIFANNQAGKSKKKSTAKAQAK